MQKTRVQSQIREDPTCCGATMLMCHNSWVCALEPWNPNSWTLMPQLLKPAKPSSWAQQQQKPAWWGTCRKQLESSLLPVCHTREKSTQQRRPSTAPKKVNKIITYKLNKEKIMTRVHPWAEHKCDFEWVFQNSEKEKTICGIRRACCRVVGGGPSKESVNPREA